MKVNQKGQEFEVLPFFLFAKEKSASCNLIPKELSAHKNQNVFVVPKKKKNRFIVMNQKGQEFEVFNLLIGAILALAILVIIVSIVNYLEDIKIDSSLKAIEQKLSNAAQSPDGSVFVSEEVILPKDFSFNSKQVSRILNIGEECVEFDFPENANWAEYSNGTGEKTLIQFTRRIETKFYVLCYARGEGTVYLTGHDNDILNCPASCSEFCCALSFGVKPDYDAS